MSPGIQNVDDNTTIDTTNLSKVIITEMSGETLCEVSIGAECTVRELKHEIERIARAPAVEQQLTCSEVILDDDDASVSQFWTGDPLVVLMIVPQWTEKQIKTKSEELQESMDEEDKEGVGAALMTLPFHDFDKAEVLSHVALFMSDDEDILKMIMNEVNQLASVVRGPVIMIMVQQMGFILQYVAEEIRGDRELCMAAVIKDGLALEFVSQEMKGDRELCTAAAAQDGLALEFVSQGMKGDRELCTAAAAQDGLALEFVSQGMKGDRELCTAAVAQNGGGSPVRLGGDEG